jgi:small-conductance mechanosensitive channel
MRFDQIFSACKGPRLLGSGLIRVAGIALLSIPACLIAANPGQAAAPADPAAAKAAPTAVATPAAAVPTAAATTTAAAPAKSAAPTSTTTLPQQIAALPKLDGTGVDIPSRGAQILAHLNAILRFYRSSTTQIQKVGEPSDVLYSEQFKQQATQVAQLAFQAAQNEAALLNKMSPNGTAAAAPNAATSTDGSNASVPEPTQAQRLATLRATTQARLNDLMAQDAALDQQITSAKAKDLPALRQKDEQVEGQVELQKAMLDALGKVASMAQAQSNTGLAGDIDRLLRAAPELASSSGKAVAPPPLENLTSANDSGVSSQAVWLFELLGTRHTIDDLTTETDALSKQAADMRAPMVNLLRSTIAQGDAAMQAAPDTTATDAQTLAATRKRYDTLATTFRVLSTAAMPLSQEIVLLEQSRINLQSWKTTVDAEYSTVLRSLLMRILAIALALIVLFIISTVWQRLTVKYVTDMRRRRQILVIRRLVLGFFSGIVVIFGFVTQFSSLATFAGFITAGIAVGLQTILLSVAAYFFIIGRFGVRVGDRITVAGVTGDVVDVGLVRFYMMELTGTGTELHPTGRVAVFANSVLFQSGTPLYKQVPGTEYAWHELTVRLNQDSDYRSAADAILRSVNSVYNRYRAQIEQQHKQVEQWMDAPLEPPHIEPRLQLAETGLQYAVLFPVEIKDAATTDEQMVHQLLSDISTNETLKRAVAAPPVVRSVIKG